MIIWYADTVEKDNHRTGFHASEAEAFAAFVAENQGMGLDFKKVYAVSVETSDDGIEVAMQTATALAWDGIPSPALGIAAR